MIVEESEEIANGWRTQSGIFPFFLSFFLFSLLLFLDRFFKGLSLVHRRFIKRDLYGADDGHRIVLLLLSAWAKNPFASLGNLLTVISQCERWRFIGIYRETTLIQPIERVKGGVYSIYISGIGEISHPSPQLHNTIKSTKTKMVIVEASVVVTTVLERGTTTPPFPPEVWIWLIPPD